MRKGLGRHNRRSAGGSVPSLVLDFAGTGTLDSRVTFTRSTTGTYYNSSGVLTTAAINAPRFDYNPSTLAPLGLLIEQSSTNLVLYSQTFNNAIWNNIGGGVTVNTTATTAPDGTLTGNKVIATTASGGHSIYQTYTFLAGSYTASVYAKSAEYTTIRVASLFTGKGVNFDLSAGTVGSATSGYTGTITSVGNGWYRCAITWTATAGADNIGFYVQTGAFTGDGTSGIYAWGYDLEALAFPTSYIPTTTAQVTRASDNASMTGTNFSSWYTQGQGTLYGESWIFSPVTAYPSPYSLNDGANTNRIQPYINNSLTSLGGDITTTGPVAQANILITVPSMTSYIKSAFSFELNNVNFAAAGILGTRDSVATIPINLVKLSIGTNAAGGAFSMYIKKITYYPTALTQTQIQAITGS